MARKISIVASLALALVAIPAWGADIRIDFSDDSGSSTPGFRIRDLDDVGPDISEAYELGRNNFDPDGLGDGSDASDLDFLRITSSTSSVAGADVVGFIVVLPDLYLTDIGAADGTFIDCFGLSFFGGGTTAINGFQIFDIADTGLTTPLLQADITLVDAEFLTVGSSGTVEPTVTINLTNVDALGLGQFITTLAEFEDFADAGGGADFVAGVFAGFNNIGGEVLGGDSVAGSAAGSVFAVPEPGTLALLAVGALLATRSRRRSL